MKRTALHILIAVSVVTFSMAPAGATPAFYFTGRWSGQLRLQDGTVTRRTLVFSQPGYCTSYMSSRGKGWTSKLPYTVEGRSIVLTSNITSRGRSGIVYRFTSREKLTPLRKPGTFQAVPVHYSRVNTTTGVRQNLKYFNVKWIFRRS